MPSSHPTLRPDRSLPGRWQASPLLPTLTHPPVLHRRAEMAVSPLPGNPTAVWTIKKSAADEFDAYIIVSFSNATLVLRWAPCTGRAPAPPAATSHTSLRPPCNSAWAALATLPPRHEDVGGAKQLAAAARVKLTRISLGPSPCLLVTWRAAPARVLQHRRDGGGGERQRVQRQRAHPSDPAAGRRLDAAGVWWMCVCVGG